MRSGEEVFALVEPERSGPVRRCVARRIRAPKEELVRFVRGPDGMAVADVEERLPGRGVWLAAEGRLLAEARTRKAFARLGLRLDDPERLAREIARRLVRRCLDLIGLARRANQAVWGYERVREALARGRVAVLLVARDASANARDRFHRLPSGVVRSEAFGREELARALGRADVVYVGVAPGRLARRLIRELKRLSGFQPGCDSEMQVNGKDATSA